MMNYKPQKGSHYQPWGWSSQRALPDDIGEVMFEDLQQPLGRTLFMDGWAKEFSLITDTKIEE